MQRDYFLHNPKWSSRASLSTALLLAIALLPLPASGASDGDRYGSIAFSQNPGGSHAWGMAWSFDSQAGATDRAIEECQAKGGGNCAQVGWFRNACGALAVDGGNGFGAGWGDSIATAERDALAECEFFNESCRVVLSRCAEPEEAESEDAEQAPADWKAGDLFRDCPECPEMVVVPAGTFRMGAPKSEEYSRDNERPVHSVSVPSFAAGVYELTFAEWDACAASGGCGGHRPEDGGWGRGRRPAIEVSWDDAQSYVRWLSGKTGKRYRLLSESEWEYVARAGTQTPFHTGSTITPQQANYDGRDSYPSGDYNPNGLYRGQPLPVGSFPANGFGLHDVHGNVWEWVEDCWNDGYAGAPADGSAWESGDCSDRVLRGGSWYKVPWFLRSANRLRNTTAFRDYYDGFRVARTLAP